MSEATFEGYVEKQQLQFKNPQNIEKQMDDTAFMQQSTEALSTFTRQYDTGSFKTSEVREAASFMLKAQQYGLNTRKLDVEDSPIYYKKVNGKKCARGYFEKKNLEKAGNRLIKLTKQRQSEISDIILKDDLQVNEQTWKRQEDDPSAPPSEADKIVDRFISVGAIENADLAIREEMNENKSAEKADQKKEQTSKYFMHKRVNEAMDTKLPNLNKVLHYYNTMMMKDYSQLILEKTPKSELPKKKEEIKNRYGARYQKFKKMFTDAKKGLVSPEAIKVFLQQDIMTLDTDQTLSLYTSMEFRVKSGEKSSSFDKYINVRNEMIDEYIKDKADYERQGEGDGGFMHFRGKKLMAEKNTSRGIDTTPTDRVYITGRSDKQVEMLQALRKALNAHPDVKDKIHFKVTSSPSSSRMDNVVIYISKLVKMEDVNNMLETFKKECGDDVLEGRENMPPANKYISDGISLGTEFDLLSIRRGLDSSDLIDKSKFDENKKIAALTHNTSNPSYTQHVSQLLYVAMNMARKKHPEIGSVNGEDDKIQNHPEAMKDVKMYFKDLLRLSDVDPATMEHSKYTA
ncbi:MAG: hypothetical protein IJU93_08370 [Lachnospiraceae bacterium]|nr:hypothetical protein [Lachnospiraceae bacterium]